MPDSNGNTSSFIPHVCYFSYLPWIAASEGRSSTALLSTTRRSTSLSHSIRVTITHPLSSVKTIKKPDVDKKTEACEALTLTEGFLFFSCRSSKQSVSRLLTLNWSEYLNTGQNT